MTTEIPENRPPTQEASVWVVFLATTGFLALMALFVFYCWWWAHHGSG